MKAKHNRASSDGGRTGPISFRRARTDLRKSCSAALLHAAIRITPEQRQGILADLAELRTLIERTEAALKSDAGPQLTPEMKKKLGFSA